MDADVQYPSQVPDAFEKLPSPILICDSDGVLQSANRAWRELAGVPPTVAPWEWLICVVEEDRDRLRKAVVAAVDEGESAEVEFRTKPCVSMSRALLCSLSRDAAGDAVGVCFDVTERRQVEERLAFMAGHDPLTGLQNRRSFEEGLARAVSRAERGAESALLLIDMDNLKAYNDSLGHLEGDQALVNFSLLLRRHVRASDLVARIGGDEFAVLLEDASLETATEIAERMRETAAVEEFVAGAREHGLGLSCGITPVVGDCDPRVLMDRADSALYAAKEGGRNRVVEWVPQHGSVQQPDRISQLVRAALRDKTLQVEWQPVVRISDGRPVYYESLVRLAVSEDELLFPGEFLPVVERLGLMARLTEQVVRRVLDELRAHPQAIVSVNLSMSDLTDADLLEEVALLVAASGVQPERLVFETSEAALLSALGGGREWMQRLRARGHRFVLDEFGTGLGTFILLREPGVDEVKLSSAVTRALVEDERSVAFVVALRKLIESQGKSVVAASLEDWSLIQAVVGAGFAFGQGFALCKPSADLGELMQAAPLGLPPSAHGAG